MIIIETTRFKKELREIAFYIKKDKLSASINFVSTLKKQMNDLPNFPYRDMTFMGYTVIYEIFEDKIEVMMIFNQNKPAT